MDTHITSPRRLIVGISGASGAVYGVRLLEILTSHRDIETHLVVSRTAALTLAQETDYSMAQLHALAHRVHAQGDLSACIASGSYAGLGMIVAPCSMRSLAEIATGMTSSLLTRAADVTLKERRRLVLLARETPLNASHLKNMLAVTEMGGIIAPPVPAFYSRPATLQEMVDHTIGRALDLFGIPHQLVKRWEGMQKAEAEA